MNSCHCLFPRLFVCNPLLLEAITKDRKLETVHLLHYTYLYMSQNLSVVREQCADRFAHRWTKFLQLRSSRGHSCVSVGCELVSKLIIQNLMSDLTWNSRHVVLFCGWILQGCDKHSWLSEPEAWMQSAGHTGVGRGLLLTGVLLQTWAQHSAGWENQLGQCGASLLLLARSVCWLYVLFFTLAVR